MNNPERFESYKTWEEFGSLFTLLCYRNDINLKIISLKLAASCNIISENEKGLLVRFYK